MYFYLEDFCNFTTITIIGFSAPASVPKSYSGDFPDA